MRRFTLPALSLRAKIVLGYLCVALAAIVVLTIVITFAVQNYFYSTERELLHTRAELVAQQVVQVYREAGGSWNNLNPLRLNSPDLFVIVDTKGQVRSRPSPSYLRLNNADVPVLQQALGQALQGQEVNGTLRGDAEGDTFAGQYIALPLRDNGKIIGAVFLAEPQLYPQGFSPNEFLVNVNWAILIAAVGVALAVLIFSLLLAHRLTRPLAALTVAAEQMKGGNFTQRVSPPASRDELGRLALTFNAMADTIESDVTELRQQEEMRRELVANIAHDLITPPTAIQGLNEVLADAVISVSKARQVPLQLIGREGQRLRRLVGAMQQMSSLGAGSIKLDLAPLELHALHHDMEA